jgi:hypothetical protein
MAKKKVYKKKQPTFSLAIIAGMIPLPIAAVADYQVNKIAGLSTTGNLQNVAGSTAARMTGYNPMTKTWQPAQLKTGLIPITVGVAVHKIASMTGMNRMIAAAGIPYFRI